MLGILHMASCANACPAGSAERSKQLGNVRASTLRSLIGESNTHQDLHSNEELQPGTGRPFGGLPLKSTKQAVEGSNGGQ
eukprot:13632647-Alexandrium_andersonii.AAC.1